MPELPEVETVRRGLAPVMEGQRIARVTLRRAGLRWPFPKDLAGRLTGQRIAHLRRRSKYLLVDLKGDVMLIHLGMSGRMTVSGAPMGRFHRPHGAPQKHDHVIFDLESGARVTLNDPRRFGAVDLFAAPDEAAHPLLRHLGPEPLGNAFNAPDLRQRLSGKRSPIKTALLDQRIVAGLGNIYVCEALFRAGIHPARAAGRISKPRIDALVPIIREVLNVAIEAGGSSLRDHRQASGDLGYFQHQFQVYDREGAPCLTLGCGGHIRRITQSGRSSFYCPRCQR